MTELLYQLDSYLRSFDAKVLEVDQETHAVALDRTAFYPGGGGQPSDLGWLKIEGNAFEVIRVKKAGEVVWHYLNPDLDMPVIGMQVEGEIDWERRYQLMRTHTAMHILCGVVFRDFGALVTGGNMEPLNGRMDFEFESLSKDLIMVIEEAVNKEITADHPVHVALRTREEAFQIPDLIRTKINLLPPGIETIRTIEIEGLDLQADGGTHVRSTAEVGKIGIPSYKSKGKINKRIYVELDT
jgi:misacylated tRNA(Ala) deacylase